MRNRILAIDTTAMTAKPYAALPPLAAVVLITLSVTAVSYWSYFRIANWIWRQNAEISPHQIVPWVVPFTAERDGLEIYALYVLTFVVIGSATFLSAWVLGGRWRLWPTSADSVMTGQHAPTWRLLVALCCALPLVIWFIGSVGFVPPENPLKEDGLTASAIADAVAVLLVIGTLTYLAVHTQLRHPRRLPALAALALLPLCFIAINTDPSLSLDFNYIFAPALRMLHGAQPNEVYLQYDLLPTLLAAGWMSLGLELNAIRLLGQAAYYIAILTVFLLARRLFIDRNLAVLLLIAVVIGRLYTSSRDVLCCFQVTPLRLDLWLPLILAVHIRGAWHWLAGLACGVLLVVANKFGIIYTLAYLQTLAVLLALEFADRPAGVSPGALLRRALLRATPSMLLILAFLWLSRLLLHNADFGNYALYYQKIGIGFLRISPMSFYWYVLPTIALTLILLVRLRFKLDRRYLHTGFLLVFCAVGNLIYFFGRSHEQALLNLTIILLFVAFLLLDLFARLLDDERERGGSPGRVGALALAGLLIAGMAAWYGENIAAKLTSQITALIQNESTYPHEVERGNLYRELAAIRAATGGSDRVFFLHRWDFHYYYFGGYRPFGYVNPFWGWIVAEPLRAQLDMLLDEGWFLVLSDEYRALIETFKISHNIRRDAAGMQVIARSASVGLPE
jgi:hypothetical protein